MSPVVLIVTGIVPLPVPEVAPRDSHDRSSVAVQLSCPVPLLVTCSVSVKTALLFTLAERSIDVGVTDNPGRCTRNVTGIVVSCVSAASFAVTITSP